MILVMLVHACAALTALTAAAWAALYVVDLVRACRARATDQAAPAPFLGAHRDLIEARLAMAFAFSAAMIGVVMFALIVGWL